jgi:Arc/MetJ family transcription regulator
MPDQIPIRMPTGRVAFATIEPLTLVGATSPADQLQTALRPGTRIERHNRVWRMGQWELEGQSIVGRIGFESSGLAELWDEQLNDFAARDMPEGLIAPFAIDPKAMRVAFQVRREIKVKSFTGALQALLNAASPTERWRVAREITEVPFEAWAADVERITMIRFNLERPNPRYGDRDRVKSLIEGTNARLAEVVARAGDDDLEGIDIDDPFIRQAIDHVDHDYGTYQAVGERRGESTVWTSEHGAAAEIRRVAADPQTKDVTGDALRRELGDPTVDQEDLAHLREVTAEPDEADATENTSDSD